MFGVLDAFENVAGHGGLVGDGRVVWKPLPGDVRAWREVAFYEWHERALGCGGTFGECGEGGELAGCAVPRAWGVAEVLEVLEAPAEGSGSVGETGASSVDASSEDSVAETTSQVSAESVEEERVRVRLWSLSDACSRLGGPGGLARCESADSEAGGGAERACAGWEAWEGVGRGGGGAQTLRSRVPVPAGFYLVLEDVTRGMGCATVSDIKVGVTTWGPDATASKAAREAAKYPPQRALAFRVGGVHARRA
jgi:Inositol polyphosphate kinase